MNHFFFNQQQLWSFKRHFYCLTAVVAVVYLVDLLAAIVAVSCHSVSPLAEKVALSWHSVGLLAAIVAISCHSISLLVAIVALSCHSVCPLAAVGALSCHSVGLLVAFFISAFTTLRQVVFGRPRFRFPSVVQWIATLVMELTSLRRDVPSPAPSRPSDDDLHILLLAPCEEVTVGEMVLGQKMRWIFLRLVVWKDDSLARSCSVIRQHTDPYRRVDNTQLCWSFSLVLCTQHNAK